MRERWNLGSALGLNDVVNLTCRRPTIPVQQGHQSWCSQSNSVVPKVSSEMFRHMRLSSTSGRRCPNTQYS